MTCINRILPPPPIYIMLISFTTRGASHGGATHGGTSQAMAGRGASQVMAGGCKSCLQGLRGASHARVHCWRGTRGDSPLKERVEGIFVFLRRNLCEFQVEKKIM